MNARFFKFLIICTTYFCLLFGNSGYSICIHDSNSYHVVLENHEDNACGESQCSDAKEQLVNTGISFEFCKEQHCVDITLAGTEITAPTPGRAKQISTPLLYNVFEHASQKSLNRGAQSRSSKLSHTPIMDKDYILTSVLRI